MRITLCIASRGHPENLLRVIHECDKRIADIDNTTIAVALDADDETLPHRPLTRARLVWSVAPREDSLGDKYNRCAVAAPAEMYVLGADDNIFLADGWDQRIRETVGLFGDGFGFVYFGRMDGSLPTQMAIPHALVEVQGFLFPPYWPFWFHDTWTDEIAHMTGRVLWTDIPVEEIGGRGGTRGCREIVFWAQLFEALRGVRENIACELSAKFNVTWLQRQLMQRRPVLYAFFMNRQHRLLNPATAIQFERRMSFDAKPSERYDRIKSKAAALLKELMGRAA